MEAPQRAYLGNLKCFVNYAEEIRECHNCREVKPFTDYSKNMHGYPRSICKACKSYNTYQAELRKKILNGNLNYLECPDELCGHIQRVGNERCKKCRTEI